MGIKQAFSLAIGSIMSSKVRSLLTMLGIIIGVASVIVLVSLVGGFSSSMTESFEAMGTNLITVMLTGRGSSATLTPNEIMTFAEENSDVIAHASPAVTVSNATIKYDTENITSTIYGANEYYDEIRSLTIAQGRFLGYLDVELRNKVCVIGSYTNSELFVGANALGNTLKLNGESYTVIGILEEKQGSAQGSQDDMVIVPYTTALRLAQSASVGSYYISAVDKDSSDAAMTKVREFLDETFNSNTNAYRLMNQADMLDRINQLSSTLTMVLVGIAAISLFVGGIGIMNIMLVSVTERTKEIGIRKAVGGKRKDIMRQFLIEAATTSAAGGILGIALGWGCAVLAGKILGIASVISINSVAIAFSVSVVIGIFFGYFPAAKASKLNPIDALKFD